MATKTAELEAILYAAGDEGVKQADLCQLLSITPSALRELTNGLKNKLAEDLNCGIRLIEINNLFKLVTDPACSEVISQYFQKDGPVSSLSSSHKGLWPAREDDDRIFRSISSFLSILQMLFGNV